MAIPYILTGRIDRERRAPAQGPGHFESLGIRYLNRKAMQTHAGPNGGKVDLDDGSSLDYDRLLVATGSSPTLPPIPGTDLDGCRHLLDARGCARDRRQAQARRAGGDDGRWFRRRRHHEVAGGKRRAPVGHRGSRRARSCGR